MFAIFTSSYFLSITDPLFVSQNESDPLHAQIQVVFLVSLCILTQSLVLSRLFLVYMYIYHVVVLTLIVCLLFYENVLFDVLYYFSQVSIHFTRFASGLEVLFKHCFLSNLEIFNNLRTIFLCILSLPFSGLFRHFLLFAFFKRKF